MAEKIACPVCYSGKIRLYCEKNKYKLRRCEACGLAFVYPPFPADLKDIYNKEYFKHEPGGGNFGYADYNKDKEPMREIFLSYLKKIENLTAGRNIFDIGAATGYFLNLAKERGWQTAGAEISSYAAGLAEKSGQEIYCGSLPEIKIEKKFDAITMWDVLEHVSDPNGYLLAANRLLKTGGILLINTIDMASLWAKFWGKKWLLIMPPEHLLYFNKNNLNLLLERNGFQALDFSKPGKRFSLPYIFNVLYASYGFKICKKLSILFSNGFWRRIAVPINVRDNICVIARKIKALNYDNKICQ